MLEGQGLFQLAARSAAYSALARDKGAVHMRNVFERNDKPSGFNLNTLTVDANTTIRAMFQAAWDKVHEDKSFITDDMIKRLEKASKSDNKEIAAERLRQAKAKLKSLRLQAQIAAASGDAKQLKRIAQQAAAAAREVASAARGLAEGIAASAATSDGSASAGGLPTAATGAQGTPGGESTTPTTAVPTTAPTMFSSEREALRKLGDDAHAAIAQAKGLIAFASQAARNRRRSQDDDHQFFRQLQQSVQDSQQDLDGALTDAGRTLSEAESGSSTGSIVQTTTLMVRMSVEVSVTANIVI